MGAHPAGWRSVAATLAGTALCLFAPAAGAFANTFHVTRTDDPHPNGCHRHDCSLREAVIKANHHPGADTVELKAKTYELTIQGDGEDASATGDLDVRHGLKIAGRGPAKTAINGDWAIDPDRLLEVLGTNTRLAASGLTLRHGDSGGSYRGGGIHVNSGSRLAITHARVASNQADVTGGIDNDGVATVQKVVFARNHTSDCCSGFYNESGGTATLTNVTFDRNTAFADTGAMYSAGLKATLRNVTFSGNRSSCCGGALIAAAGVLNITNATFSGNSTTGDGGAIDNSGGTTNLNNVTITRNVADSDNDGSGDGGGVGISGGTFHMRNSILAGNIDRGGEAPNCAPGFISSGHNLFGDESGCAIAVPIGGGDIFTLDPRLAPLAHNGGFTETVALKRHSPAINHGSPSPPGSGGDACAKRDQRGVKRPQGPRCDIGAYERRPHRPH